MRESRKAREGVKKRERGKEEGGRGRHAGRQADRVSGTKREGRREGGKKVGDMKWQNERVTDVKREFLRVGEGRAGEDFGGRGAGRRGDLREIKQGLGATEARLQTSVLRRPAGTSPPSIVCAVSQSVLRSGAALHRAGTCEGVGTGLLKTHENKVSSLFLSFFFF